MKNFKFDSFELLNNSKFLCIYVLIFRYFDKVKTFQNGQILDFSLVLRTRLIGRRDEAGKLPFYLVNRLLQLGLQIQVSRYCESKFEFIARNTRLSRLDRKLFQPNIQKTEENFFPVLNHFVRQPYKNNFWQWRSITLEKAVSYLNIIEAHPVVNFSAS